MKQELCQAFCDALTVRDVPMGLAVSTAFSFPDGDRIGFYVKEVSGGFEIQDNGLIFPALEASGLDRKNKAREEAVKKDLENDVRAFNGLGYFRMLTENGPRARLTWAMLRRAAEDRRTLVASLRKYEAQAGQIAEKADIKDKGEALSLKKTIANAADSLEKVTRESTTMEGRLQSDCQSLLLKITPALGK